MAKVYIAGPSGSPTAMVVEETARQIEERLKENATIRVSMVHRVAGGGSVVAFLRRDWVTSWHDDLPQPTPVPFDVAPFDVAFSKEHGDV